MPTHQMEPTLPSFSFDLENMATELMQKDAALFGILRPQVAKSLARLVRSMNCYYSNLIEDHHTRPTDIDRAMLGEYDTQPEKRNLQLEARAHIQIQELLEQGEGPAPPTQARFLLWVHREFCNRLPPELLWAENGNERIPVVPGQFRNNDVTVGQHVAIKSNLITDFLKRFDAVYGCQKVVSVFSCTFFKSARSGGVT